MTTPKFNISEMLRFLLLNISMFFTLAADASEKEPSQFVPINCPSATEVYTALQSNKNVELILTGTDYIFHKSLPITAKVKIRSNESATVYLHTIPGMLSLFELNSNASLLLQNIQFEGSDVKATHFITTDSNASRLAVSIKQCSFIDFSRSFGCENLYFAAPSSIADSIVITSTYFENNAMNILQLNGETDKGNAYKIRMEKNTFINNEGVLIDFYRSGGVVSKSEMLVSDNTFNNCNTTNDLPLFKLTGLSKTNFFFNSFIHCNTDKVLIAYIDSSKAQHLLTRNLVTQSGSIQRNEFVIEEKNTIQ